jgi:hypothetical protein
MLDVAHGPSGTAHGSSEIRIPVGDERFADVPAHRADGIVNLIPQAAVDVEGQPPRQGEDGRAKLIAELPDG